MVPFLYQPSNSQAAECRVHDPTLFVPLIMVTNSYQTVSKQSKVRINRVFHLKHWLLGCGQFFFILIYYLWPNKFPILSWRNLSLVYFGDISIS